MVKVQQNVHKCRAFAPIWHGFLQLIMKQVMMEPQSQEARIIDISQPGKSFFKSAPSGSASVKRLQIRESVSWLICFGIVAVITGTLLVYKIDVIMFIITSIMFYFSLAGLIFFIAKGIRLSRSQHVVVRNEAPHLN